VSEPSESDRVRSYILAQANKLSLPDLVAKVRTDTAPLRAAAAAVPAEKFFDRPAAHDWSAAEVYSHILDMNDLGAASIEGILDGGAVPSTVQDLMTAGTRQGLKTADDYWRAYQAKREQLLSRVLEAKGDEHLEITITHSTFGPFSWREWLLVMRVHDLDHMRQLGAIAAQFST
jgi:DinB superfamily